MFVVIAKQYFYMIKMLFFLFMLMWSDREGALANEGEHNDPSSFYKY